MALASAMIDPAGSAKAATVSTIFSGIEVGARYGKAAITGKQEHWDLANKTLFKNGGSYLTGESASWLLRKYPKNVSNLFSNLSSKAYEKAFDASSNYLGTSDPAKVINSIPSSLYESAYRGLYAPKVMERKYSNLVSQYYFGIDIK